MRNRSDTYKCAHADGVTLRSPSNRVTVWTCVGCQGWSVKVDGRVLANGNGPTDELIVAVEFVGRVVGGVPSRDLRRIAINLRGEGIASGSGSAVPPTAPKSHLLAAAAPSPRETSGRARGWRALLLGLLFPARWLASQRAADNTARKEGTTP